MTQSHQHKKNSSPCPYFPSCGGCDFLDLSTEEYQLAKKKILTDLFLSKNITLPEARWIWTGSHSRRKVTFQIDKENNLGFFTKKTNSIIKVSNCFVAEPEISNFILHLQNFLKKQEQNFYNQTILTLFDNGLDLVFTAKNAPNFLQENKLIEFGKTHQINVSYRIKQQTIPIFQIRKNQIFYPDFKINLDSDIFIQATKSGLDNIKKICVEEIINFTNSSKLKPSQIKAIDLYAGFGAYSFAICNNVGQVFAVEGMSQMTDLIKENAAANNLSNKIKAINRDLFTNPIDYKELKEFNFAIINPPRNGASPQILEIAKSEIKNLIYVSCNPQSFATDAQMLLKHNFQITNLHALDQFYSTKHLELIAVFKR